MPRTLYHLPLSPFCRKVRIILGEKHINFDPVIEKPWAEREGFLALNHGGTVPVLVDEVSIPFEFRRRQAAILTGFPRPRDNAELRTLFAAIKQLVDHGPPPEVDAAHPPRGVAPARPATGAG